MFPVDAADFESDLWGRERLLATVECFCGERSEQMVKDILGYRRRFVDLARQIDDTSMVVVRRTVGEPAARGRS